MVGSHAPGSGASRLERCQMAQFLPIWSDNLNQIGILLGHVGPFHQKHLYRVDGKLFRIGHEALEEVSDVLILFDAETQLISSAIPPS